MKEGRKEWKMTLMNELMNKWPSKWLDGQMNERIN